jgi:hypothetical protein
LVVNGACHLNQIGALDGGLKINHGRNRRYIELSGNVDLHQLYSLDIDHLRVESIFSKSPASLVANRGKKLTLGDG